MRISDWSSDVCSSDLITIAASLPLVWVSFAGQRFEWASLETAYFLVPAALAVVALVFVERNHAEPLIPPKILLERTTILAIVASIAVGIAQFGTSVFLSQFFQVAQGLDRTSTRLNSSN